jgi:DnaJ like chaperone protein
LSIWGRIIEGVQELSWGSLFGLDDAPADLADDVSGRAEDKPCATKQVGFTIAVIALGAKMAKASGAITQREIDAFHQVFQAPESERRNVEFFFNMAQKSTAGAETYARQVKRLMNGCKPVLEDLMGALFHIAKADGVITASEDEFLRKIAEIFGFEERCYRRLRAYHVGSELAPVVDEDPYLILGVEPESSTEVIRKRYRELVRENHPDKAMAEGLPQEFVSIATAKLALINAAYARLNPKQGLH